MSPPHWGVLSGLVLSSAAWTPGGFSSLPKLQHLDLSANSIADFSECLLSDSDVHAGLSAGGALDCDWTGELTAGELRQNAEP